MTEYSEAIAQSLPEGPMRELYYYCWWVRQTGVVRQPMWYERKKGN